MFRIFLIYTCPDFMLRLLFFFSAPILVEEDDEEE